MPLLQLSLAVLGLSQNRLCFLHSKEPMTEQFIVPVPSLLDCHPNIKKDEKNHALHYCTSLLCLSSLPTHFEQRGIPTVDEHKFPSSIYTIYMLNQFISSSKKDYLL